ncbi:MAG: hypothetical protein HKN20_05735 [Gemmatimonadetes bacterium]|nr:hypothetical protein [Gemmatimonadota bacterium]
MIAHWYLEETNEAIARWAELLAEREADVLRAVLRSLPDDPDCSVWNADRKDISPPEPAD